MRIVICVLLIGCSAGRVPDGDPADLASVDELPSVDTAKPVDATADTTAAAPDLAWTDLARPVRDFTVVTDLTPPADLSSPCNGSCVSGQTCMRTSDQCSGDQRCIVAQNCGGGSLPCCTTGGMPTSIGYCEIGMVCTSGTCIVQACH